MTGLVGLNKPVFDNVAAQLRALGFIVINPSETDPIIIEGEPFHWFYFRCILGDIMDIAHKGVSYVVTLDDAGASLGARCELHTALNIGAGVIHHSDVPGVTYVPNLPKEVKVA
jgi:hypothetical protein